MWDLVPRPGIEPRPPLHWEQGILAREVPRIGVWLNQTGTWKPRKWHSCSGLGRGLRHSLTKALRSCHWCSSRHWEEPCSRACCSRSSWRRLFFPDSLIWARVVMALPRRASLRRAERRSSPCPCRMHWVDLWRQWGGGWGALSVPGVSVVRNFMCELGWAMGWMDSWSNIILRAAVRVFLDEINIWISE